MNYYNHLLVLHVLMLFCKDILAAVRMMEPLQRSSLWRRGEPGAERNIHDGDLNCGGYEEQWLRQEGCCGICGDACGTDKPNEYGGIYAKEIIAATYNQGDIIEVQIVRINVQALGYFEFRICEAPDQSEVSPDCLDRNVLPIIDSNNNTRFYPGTGGQTFRLTVVLPSDLFCTRCVLQFKYKTGYRLPDSYSACDCLGCGQQEQYYNCADISITRNPNYVPPSTSTASESATSSVPMTNAVRSTIVPSISSTTKQSIITIYPSPSVVTVTQFASATTCIEPSLDASSSSFLSSGIKSTILATPTNSGIMQTINTRVTTEVVTTTVYQTPSNLDIASRPCIESTSKLSSDPSLNLETSISDFYTLKDISTATPTSLVIESTSRRSCICPSNMETVTVSGVCPLASTELKECSNTIKIQPSCPEVSTIYQTSSTSYIAPTSSQSNSRESNELIWPWPNYYGKYHVPLKKNTMLPNTRYQASSLRQFKKLQYYIISGRTQYNQNQIIHSPANEKPQASEKTTGDKFFNKLLYMVKNLTPHNYTVFDKEVNNALKSECPTSTVFVTVTKHVQPSTTMYQIPSSSIIPNQENEIKPISPTPVMTTSPPIKQQPVTTTKPDQCLPYSPQYRCFSVYRSVNDNWCKMNCPDKFCPYYLCLCACTELQVLPTTPKPAKVCRSIRAGIPDSYCVKMCSGSYCPTGYCECVQILIV